MSIYKKLLDFQKLGISIRKDKKNPHFKNDYASLNEVLDKIKKPLNDLGLVVAQSPQLAGLETIITDTDSGESIVSHIPYLNASDMQKLGGAITYARRYSLVAMLGLEDDDDDGNTASTPAPAMSPEIALTRIASAKTLAELQTTWKMLPNAIQKDPEVLAMKDQQKLHLTNQSA